MRLSNLEAWRWKFPSWELEESPSQEAWGGRRDLAPISNNDMPTHINNNNSMVEENYIWSIKDMANENRM
jgi:hypothetical protein